jgi:NTE family protein
MARTPITWEGKEKRLLDELDIVYALSGGTFTGAYYALFGERIFHDFEYRFLRKDWEKELTDRILYSPRNWFRLWSPYFGRAYIMAELLDEALYEGKTYGDLLSLKRRPGLLIHASDMATLSRFEFVQVQFDLICSDLSQFGVAHASAASAALPLLLSPITLKNYAGTCGYEAPAWMKEASHSPRPAQRQRARELLSYLDVHKRPNVHLLDGGLSDNMALRGVLESSALHGGIDGGLERLIKSTGVKKVKKLVFLSVNAETSPDTNEYRSEELPVFSKVFGSLVDIPINRYSSDTLLFMRLAVAKWRADLRANPPGKDSVFDKDSDIYFIDVSLGAMEDAKEQEYLMKIPTSLHLTDEQIDRLLVAASRLIMKDPEFKRLMKDLQPASP